MTYKVEEVSSGLCTGTLRGNAIEAKINQMASQGWKFEQYETIVGRSLLELADFSHTRVRTISWTSA